MSTMIHSFAGIIRVEPLLREAGSECDDSTVGLLLASFARRRCLTDDEEPQHRSAKQASEKNRLRWLSLPNVDAPLKADLARLVDELEAEYGLMGGAAS